MCLTSSLPVPSNCSLSGGIRRILVAEAATLVLSGPSASFTVVNTGTTRYQVTAIDAALEFYEIPFDKNRDASATVENVLAGRLAFTHTIAANLSTDDFDTQRSVMELQDCCGYVALIQHQSGRWYLYGVNFSKDDASYDAAYLRVQANFATGANVADEAAGHAITISATNVNSYALPVTAAAATGVTIIAHTP